MTMEKTAMITGAAMGMGALMAKTLAERGWRVFAGVLPGADASELGDHAGVTKIEQDVTSDASVRASAEAAAGALGDKPLGLLINNAGVANLAQGVVEGLSIDEGKTLFEINTWGPLRVLQAFLPLVRRGAPHSRIINFASGAVKANPACSGVYNMSKHAVVGLTRTLRHELAPFGIQATSVEPGAVKTHMTANSRESTKAIWQKVSQEMNEIYGPHLKESTMEVLPGMIDKGNPPEVVVNQVLGLLEKKKWKPSYLVGKDVAAMAPLYKCLPENMFENMIQGASKIPQYKG